MISNVYIILNIGYDNRKSPKVVCETKKLALKYLKDRSFKHNKKYNVYYKGSSLWNATTETEIKKVEFMHEKT